MQTSFLLRCWFESTGSLIPITYTVENTQTGDKLRSADLNEILCWVAEMNARLVGGLA